MKIKYKFMMSLLLIMAIPLLGTFFVTYHGIQNQFKQELLISQHQLMNQLNKSIQTSLKDIDNKLMSIYVTKDLYDYAANFSGEYNESVEEYNRMENLLRVLILSLGGNSNVFLYLDYNKSLHKVDSKNFTLQVSNFSDGADDWLKVIKDGNGASTIYSSEGGSNSSVITGRSITNVIRSKYVGALAIELNHKFFEESLGVEHLNDFILVKDSQGNILYSTQQTSINKKEMILVESDINTFGWTIEKYIPRSHLRQVAWNSIQITFYLGGIVVFIIAILLWIYYSKQISEPIVKLVGSMKKAGTGNFKLDNDDKVRYRKDEIGLLAKQFHSMISTLDDLIQNQYELKLQESYTRVKALQAQINPHFLYNTLTSLYSEALDVGSESICSMIKSLSNMFRYTTESDTDVVPLGREVEHIRNYLQIQKFRFESNLCYVIDIDESLLTVPCVKLSLQPIVENAVIHGISKKGKGDLFITARKTGDGILIVVKDTGVGISPDNLENINSMIHHKIIDEEHIGLNNVQQRILFHFLGSEGIQVQSQMGFGTSVTIKWRVLTNDKNINY